MQIKVWFLCLLLSFTSLACMTPLSSRYGIQEDQLAKVPARIAVLPCQLWPQGARFVELSPNEASSSDNQVLCQQTDAFVLKGFEGQPYMRGLSPKLVKALVEKAQPPLNLSEIEGLWYRPGQVCDACRHPASYYNEVIASRPEWRTWLGQLSRNTKNSDAVLIPLIMHQASRGLDDRGLFYAQRKAGIALLLVDTNNGSLIWIGGREAETRRPLTQLSAASSPQAFAPWDELWAQLFVSDLWREFPGRQN